MSVYKEATRHVGNLSVYALVFSPYTSLVSYYFDLTLYDIQKENHSTASNRGYVNIPTIFVSVRSKNYHYLYIIHHYSSLLLFLLYCYKYVNYTIILSLFNNKKKNSVCVFKRDPRPSL